VLVCCNVTVYGQWNIIVDELPTDVFTWETFKVCIKEPLMITIYSSCYSRPWLFDTQRARHIIICLNFTLSQSECKINSVFIPHPNIIHHTSSRTHTHTHTQNHISSRTYSSQRKKLCDSNKEQTLSLQMTGSIPRNGLIGIPGLISARAAEGRGVMQIPPVSKRYH